MTSALDKHNDKSQTISVLLVEDSPDQCALVRQVLAEFGPRYEIDCCSALTDALLKLRERHRDVVLLDLELDDVALWDGINGLSLQQVREVAPGVPVVVLSGMVEQGDIAARLVAMGAFGVAYKPTMVSGKAISRVLENALLWTCPSQRSDIDAPACPVPDERGAERRDGDRRGTTVYKPAVRLFRSFGHAAALL